MKKKKKHYREIDLTLRVLRMVREQGAVNALGEHRGQTPTTTQPSSPAAAEDAPVRRGPSGGEDATA